SCVTNSCTMDFDYNFCCCFGTRGKARWLFAALLGSILCGRSTYSSLNIVSRYCYLRYFTDMVRPFGWKLRPIQSLYQHLGSCHNDLWWSYGTDAGRYKETSGLFNDKQYGL